MFGKVDISKWIAAEIHKTELALLRAEDELAEAQFRVDAMRARIARLKDNAAGLAPITIRTTAQTEDQPRWIQAAFSQAARK